MNRAIAWFAENHVAANLVMLVIVGAGLATIPTITQQFIPDIELEVVNVTTTYPGASPEEVESSITNRIEERLEGLQGIKNIRSTSAEGASNVSIELLSGEDPRERLDDIRAAIDLIDTFPEDAEEPTVAQMEIYRQVLSVAVSGAVAEDTLKRLGQQVRDEITALPGISDAKLVLARPYEISIEVSEASLRRFGLRFDDVVAAVQRSSLDLPGGTVKTDSGEILLRARGQAYEGGEFEQIALVSRRDGTRLRLGDVATVIDGFEESDRFARFDGHPTVIVEVYRVGDQKSLAISDTVHGYVERARARLPGGVALTVWNDESVVLGDRLDLMLRNAAGGFLLVVLILSLFLRLRLALWVSLGIPISFLGAVALMPPLGMTINFISLLAFIVVLGIVVDDAIVVGENTYTYQTRTGEKLKGAILGAQTIVVPVTFGVLTTIAAFAPLGFLPGPMGRMTIPLPVIIIACLMFSLFESMFILPAHLGHGRKPLDAPSSTAISAGWRALQARIASGLAYLIDDLYRPLLRRALEWRYLTVSIALSLLLFTLGTIGAGWLKFVFQEHVEADFIVADLTMAQGTPAFVTREMIERLEAGARQVRDEVDAENPDRPTVFTHIMSSVGEQPFRNRSSNGPLGGGAVQAQGHVGEIQVEVLSFDQRDIGVFELTQRWRERVGDIAGAEELVFRSSLFDSGPAIEVELSGHDLYALRRAASDVSAKLSTYPGVFDIADSFRGGKQELDYEILPSAEALGLTLQDLARQLRQGFYGHEVQNIQRGRDEVKVMVRYPAADRRSLADVERMRIRSADGTEVPFSSVASAKLGTGFSAITHVDRRRVVTVTADVDNAVANANEIVRDLKSGAMTELLSDYPGVHYSFEGEQAEQREFLATMGRGMLAALAVIYALLAVPLRSYLQPFIIMSAIPFGLVGAAWGHILLGYKLSMYSVIGLVALSGIVVNSSLVLVHAVNHRIADGMVMRDAVVDAGGSRFRAILLTSLTTFAGLTPMMLETSMQAKFMIPMAISIAYGVLFASFITLFLVPASYMVLEDLRTLPSRLRSRPAPAASPGGADRAPLAS